MSNAPTQPPAPETEIVYGFGGRALRRINPKRLFRTGDSLVNVHGQALWEVASFNPNGVRVIAWPHGTTSDWTWEAVLGFYERVPEKDKPDGTPEIKTGA